MISFFYVCVFFLNYDNLQTDNLLFFYLFLYKKITFLSTFDFLLLLKVVAYRVAGIENAVSWAVGGVEVSDGWGFSIFGVIFNYVEDVFDDLKGCFFEYGEWVFVV